MSEQSMLIFNILDLFHNFLLHRSYLCYLAILLTSAEEAVYGEGLEKEMLPIRYLQ